MRIPRKLSLVYFVKRHQSPNFCNTFCASGVPSVQETVEEDLVGLESPQVQDDEGVRLRELGEADQLHRLAIPLEPPEKRSTEICTKLIQVYRVPQEGRP